MAEENGGILKAIEDFSANVSPLDFYVVIQHWDLFLQGLLNTMSLVVLALLIGGALSVPLAIARAILRDPAVLLLDEPFAPLDLYTRKKLQDELIYIWQESGMSCVFVTHNIDSALFLGQKIMIMSNHPGRIDNVFNVDMSYPRKLSNPVFEELKRELLIRFGMAFHL